MLLRISLSPTKKYRIQQPPIPIRIQNSKPNKTNQPKKKPNQPDKFEHDPSFRRRSPAVIWRELVPASKKRKSRRATTAVRESAPIYIGPLSEQGVVEERLGNGALPHPRVVCVSNEVRSIVIFAQVTQVVAKCATFLHQFARGWRSAVYGRIFGFNFVGVWICGVIFVFFGFGWVVGVG